jgi:type II secretory pathway pseudopilin PulG
MSLIELLVAVVLLAVGALAAATMQRTAIKANQASATRQSAASLGRQLLEMATMTPYNNPSLAPTTPNTWVAPALGPSGSLDAQGLNTGSARIFERTWQITNDAPLANLKTVRVRVRWNERGQNQQLIMSTLKVG